MIKITVLLRAVTTLSDQGQRWKSGARCIAQLNVMRARIEKNNAGAHWPANWVNPLYLAYKGVQSCS